MLAAPLGASAQQTGTVWRIGFISVSYAPIEDILFKQLRELGYWGGKTSSWSVGTRKDGRSGLQSLLRSWFDSTST